MGIQEFIDPLILSLQLFLQITLQALKALLTNILKMGKKRLHKVTTTDTKSQGRIGQYFFYSIKLLLIYNKTRKHEFIDQLYFLRIVEVKDGVGEDSRGDVYYAVAY